MSDQHLDYAAIRRKVEKGVQRQKWMNRIAFFIVHLLFFAVAMVIVWGNVTTDTQLRARLFDSESRWTAIVLVPTIMWAAVLLFHAAALYMESRRGEKDIRERLLMREIGEDILRQGLADAESREKPKRHEARLSDDGELLAIDEDDPIAQEGDQLRTHHAGVG
jgi:hypothetical protein